MKFNVKDEYKRFMEEPDLIEFRKNVLAKPNGYKMFDEYLNARVQVKNDEALLEEMSPNARTYYFIQAKVKERKRIFQEAEKELKGPSRTLEKVVSAPKVTIDPLDKAVDVLRGIFGGSEEHSEEQSTKPSLWKIFFK